MNDQSGDIELREQWARFLADVEPHRRALFRYCLALTKNPFDADDLSSETMIKTFTSRAYATGGIQSYASFMIRTASRSWIDEQRRHTQSPSGQHEVIENAEHLAMIRETTQDLYAMYTPIQRAVIVLKEVFGLSHGEIGKTLAISPEVSRVTLHRSKSVSPELSPRIPRVSKELAERFADAFLSHDIDRVKSLLLDDMEGVVFPIGLDIFPKDEFTWLTAAFKHPPSMLHVCEILGDVAILAFYESEKTKELTLKGVWLLEESGGHISRIVSCGVSTSPDLMKWVAEHADFKYNDLRVGNPL